MGAGVVGEWVSGWRKSRIRPWVGRCMDEYQEWMDERMQKMNCASMEELMVDRVDGYIS